jgi:hypothetical protein
MQVFALLLVFSAIRPAFTQRATVGIASVNDGDTATGWASLADEIW